MGAPAQNVALAKALLRPHDCEGLRRRLIRVLGLVPAVGKHSRGHANFVDPALDAPRVLSAGATEHAPDPARTAAVDEPEELEAYTSARARRVAAAAFAFAPAREVTRRASPTAGVGIFAPRIITSYGRGRAFP